MKKVTITDEYPLKGIVPSAGEDVVLIRDGHAVALVTAFDDDDLEWYAQEHAPAFIESVHRERKKIAAGQSISHEDLMRTLDVKSTEQLLGELANEGRAVGIAAADVPDEPGFYSIFVDDAESLPDFAREHLQARQTRLIYLGIASTSLHQRLMEQDLRHQRPSTFFRTLGAILNYRPEPGSLCGKDNQQNYCFSKSATHSIVEWINAHLRIKWMVAHGTKRELEASERSMIRELCPAFNLEHNPHRIKRIGELRDQCRKIAQSPTP